MELFSQQGLQSSSGGLSFRRITFVPAQRPDSHTIAPSVDLCPLNSEMPSMLAGNDGAHATARRHLADKGFFPESNVQLAWSGPYRAGAGLVNLGNTCFMNSVLQCLTHTPPLAELCLRDNSISSSPESQRQLDPIAATQAHIKRALAGSQSAMQPKWHARNLRAINRRFRLGRQEDAHEYLRCVLDAMHEAFLKHIKPKPPPQLAATTFIQRIFGGKLRSQIICEGVDYTSSTFDPFLDLSLEITKANSLIKALQHFTAAEVLDGDNRYRCPKNNKLVRAHKRISIDEAPNVLTVHLKRFDFFGRGHKISKKVDFGFELDLAPYMTHQHHKQHQRHSHKQQQHVPHHHLHGHHTPVIYDLFAVLVHLGHSLHSGHYVCYVKAGNGTWHLCDDHRVAPVSQRVVEGQQAYILFYMKRQPKAASALSASVAAVARNAASVANHTAVEQLAGSSEASTRTPLIGGAAVLAQGLLVAGRSVQQQQQQLAGVTAEQPKQSADVSAAEAVRKVTTSSTESTANASPASAQENRSPEAVDSLQQQSIEPMVHGHHHATRSRPLPLSSLHRHLQLHKELVKLRAAGRKQRLTATVADLQRSGAGSSKQKQQLLSEQQGSIALPTASAALGEGVSELGRAGSKRQRQPDQQQELRSPKQQRHEQVEQQPQQQQEQLQIQAQQQQQQQKEPGRSAEVQQQQASTKPAMYKQPTQGPSLQQQQQSRVQAGQHNDPQQDTQLLSHQHQQQLGQQSAAVTGAAALQLFICGSSAANSSSSGWEGGDAQLAAQAVALQRASQRRQREQDEWDAEYDRGKLKKVRKNKAQQDDGAAAAEDGPGPNRFQEAWDQQLPQKARKEAWRADAQQRPGGRPGRGRGGGPNRGGRHGGSRDRGGRHGGRGGGRAGFRGRGGGRGGRGRGH